MLTAFVTRPPSSAAATCSATITPARSWASSVDAARCGVTTTLSSSSSGPSYGSCAKTSIAARGELAGAQRLDQRLLVDELAARGVDHPRAVGQLRDRVAPEEAARLGRERQVQRQELRRREHLVRRSRRARRRARGSAPWRRTGRRRRRASRGRARGARPAGRCGRSRARRASCPRARPRPSAERSQRPCFSAACACGMLRASATSRPTVCSAAEVTVDSGALATTIPRRVAASTSTLSTPTPARPITFRRSARSIRSAVSFVAERITIAS